MIPPDPISPGGAFITLLFALIILPVVFGVVIRAPKLVVLGFLGVLFLFSDSSWGQLTIEANIYSRGAGMFYFSLLNLALLASGFALLCKKLAASGSSAQLAPPLFKFFIAFIFLIFCHIVIGLMLEVSLNEILGYNGLINILNMLVFMYLVIEAFKNERDRQQLLFIILGLATIRVIFGLVRFVFFGGDTANPYKNFEQINVKILFFDIGDNFVMSIAAFCAAWLLLMPNSRISGLKRLMAAGLLLLQVAGVALSFRRSSLIGLGCMFIPLIWHLPRNRRIIFLVFAAGLLSAIAFVFFEQRLSAASVDRAQGAGILESLFYDIAPKNNIQDNRFYELYAAAKSLGANWPIGLGTWGTFTGDEDLLSYHFGVMNFVHSGFGHIILKAGIVGLIVFCGLLAAYCTHYFRTRKYLHGNALLVSDAGFAGFMFWIPTLLIGTPIIEFRTMMLIGITLALPFVAVRMEGSAPYNVQERRNSYPEYAVA